MRTRRHLGSVAALIVLALTGSLFVAAPAHAAPGTTPLEIEILTKRDDSKGIFTTKRGIFHDDKGPYVGYADDAVVTARVTSNGAPVSDARVILQRQLKGSTTWTNFDYTSGTNGDGLVQQIWALVGTAKYRYYFDGEGTPYASAYSSEHTIKVQRDFNAKIVEKTRHAILKGKAAPDWNKKKVKLFKKVGKKWKAFKVTRTSKSGAWAFKLPYPPRRGKTQFKAVIPAKGLFVKGTLRAWTEKRVF